MRRDVKLSRDVTTMEIATSHNNLIDDWFNQRGIVVLHVRHASEYISLSVSFKQQREKRLIAWESKKRRIPRRRQHHKTVISLVEINDRAARILAHGSWFCGTLHNRRRETFYFKMQTLHCIFLHRNRSHFTYMCIVRRARDGIIA